jgi:hypothetical protein
MLSRKIDQVSGVGGILDSRILKHKYYAVQKMIIWGQLHRITNSEGQQTESILHKSRFIHNNGIQSNRCDKSQCTVNKQGNLSLTQLDKSNVNIPYLVGSFCSVLSEQLYNFLLAWTAGNLRCGLSTEVACLHICAVIQQEPYDICVSTATVITRRCQV